MRLGHHLSWTTMSSQVTKNVTKHESQIHHRIFCQRSNLRPPAWCHAQKITAGIRWFTRWKIIHQIIADRLSFTIMLSVINHSYFSIEKQPKKIVLGEEEWFGLGFPCWPSFDEAVSSHTIQVVQLHLWYKVHFCLWTFTGFHNFGASQKLSKSKTSYFFGVKKRHILSLTKSCLEFRFSTE